MTRLSKAAVNLFVQTPADTHDTMIHLKGISQAYGSAGGLLVYTHTDRFTDTTYNKKHITSL